MRHGYLKLSFYVSLSTIVVATVMSASVGYKHTPPSPVVPFHDQVLQSLLYDFNSASPMESPNLHPVLQWWREMEPGVGDQYWGGDWSAARDIDPLTWLPPQRQHLARLSLIKRNHQDSMSPQKRSSTLNEVIRRLMAMQGHSFHRGRATRMRFGAGRRK